MMKHKALSCAAGMALTVGLALAGNAHAAETKRADFGKPADITLGYADLATYVSNPQYFGAPVGHFANRINKGQYKIDDKAYQAPVNNGVNSLHGGTKGFDKVNWKVVKVADGDKASVVLEYVSPDGDMGYPGEMTTKPMS